MNAIETRSLRKIYPAPAVKKRRGVPAPPAPAGGIVAIDSLDLTVNDGEFFGVLGPNGAGKTTLIGILTTRVRITAGEARVAGAKVTTEPAAVRRRIGVVPQRPNPDRSLSVIDNLVFHATYFGIARADAARRGQELLERLGIADKANAKVDQLSGGQQQRLMIARALTHDPRVVFLDEPTVGLDPQARLSLWEILRELHGQGRTIVMSTHYMEEADQLCALHVAGAEGLRQAGDELRVGGRVWGVGATLESPTPHSLHPTPSFSCSSAAVRVRFEGDSPARQNRSIKLFSP